MRSEGVADAGSVGGPESGAKRHTPVLISGAVIAGLSAALLLEREGITSVVLEKKAALSTQPRARRFHPRSTEILRQLGLADAIAAVSPTLGSFGVLAGPTLAQARPPAMTENLHKMRARLASMGRMSPGPNIAVPQSVLEPVLLQAARERGVTVHFETEPIAFEQDSSGVTALLPSSSSMLSR
ncbi:MULTISPECIES: FAD-dependent monooxygenase [unclassified Caballeronia]|uniref:FAD-dependent monooxygenase n=1 Tax=unclassified Caballeronia TaxID=2646786 RepID=UPI002028FC6C|nr:MULTISPECIES: FAD-dependent monooxygenase [unclassified Caballeronia]